MAPSSPDPATGSSLAETSAGMARMREDFLDFIEAEYTLVVRFVMRATSARIADAEDAAQEAFCTAWRTLTTGVWGRVRDPRAWIRVVAVNHYRRGLLREHLVAWEPWELRKVAEPGPGPGEVVGQARDLMIALNQVHDPEARMVLALDMDGFTGPEIAGLLGITAQRARDLRKKARHNLHQHLSKSSHHSQTLARPTAERGRHQ